MSKVDDKRIAELVEPIQNDLLSGAAELALRAISIFQMVLSESEADSEDELRAVLKATAISLVDCQPAMAPIFHLSNSVLNAIEKKTGKEAIIESCQATLDAVEKQLCQSAATIAETAFELIEYGSLVFAYSFSSTVVSALLHARSKGKYFRVACTEARPSMEGRKLASRLAAGGIEVVHTFDNAMGLVLPSACAAFMGVDCVGRPGVVNKVGSWMLATACQQLKVPLYALSGTEKLVGDNRLFEFERHERPGAEVWDEAPKGVRLLNHQFDLVPFDLLTGLVTERGILKEADIEPFITGYKVNSDLKLSPQLTVSE